MVFPSGPVRAHGLERPFDSRQLASWVVFGLFIVAFFVLYSPVHTGAAGITMSCLYALMMLATLCTAWRAMHIDPSDRGALAKRMGNAAPIETTPERKNFCYHCEAYVNQRSKHCRR